MNKTDLLYAWQHGQSLASIFGYPFSAHDLSIEHSKPEDYQEGDPRPGSGVTWDDSEGYGHVREELVSGRWIALGYLHPRTVNTPITIIPKLACLEARFEPEHSMVRGDGLIHSGVRIIPARYLASSISETNPVGRPGSAQKILEVYNSLNTDGLIDHLKSKTECCRKIQKKISEEFGMGPAELKGYGLETIRRHISDSFDDNRSQKINTKL
ncbi:MAG: hypothetical protein P1V34_10560 [Alphaproteobacteria bacterium]|nr:hypothetical protein [Alphaproteobacteria bacterium]